MNDLKEQIRLKNPIKKIIGECIPLDRHNRALCPFHQENTPSFVVKGSGRLKKILFDDTPEVHEACNDFYGDSEARRLFDCYRRAKNYLLQNGI